MTDKNLIRHYSRLIALLLWTAFFGVTLFFQRPNIVDRVDLFQSQYMDWLVGGLMIGLPIIKVLSVYEAEQKRIQKWQLTKKWSLIAIFVLWLIITWAYLFNDVPNVGYVMSSYIAFTAYAELGRGDFEY